MGWLYPTRASQKFSVSKTKQALLANVTVEFETNAIDRFRCYALKDKSKTIQWIKSRNCVPIKNNVLGLCVLPNRRYSGKCFAETYRAQYGNAMLVHWEQIDVHQHSGRKIVETSGTYVGYLGDWLSVLNKQAFTYISTFSNVHQTEVVCQFTANSTPANSTGWNCLPIRIKIH